MIKSMDSHVLLSPSKRISLPSGDVLRGVKTTDAGFIGFGEAYFSYIHYQEVKAWKLHKRYTANYTCPLGQIKIVILKSLASGQPDFADAQEFILSEESSNYQRLTIPPGVWYGFKGLAQPSSLIFSLLSGEHSPDEQESFDFQQSAYNWE